jgi:hypothetical protein
MLCKCPMPTVLRIAPCMDTAPCFEYPCAFANPPAAYAAPIMAGATAARFFLQTRQPSGFSRQKPDLLQPSPHSKNGRKYFQLIGELPQDIMFNFTDIIAQCTITAAANRGNPYTDIKDGFALHN